MFLIGCSFLHKQHIVDGCSSHTLLQSLAVSRSHCDPDLRCLSTSGVGSEVDPDFRGLFYFGLRHVRFSESTAGCQVSVMPVCKLQTPT